jgi:hypothetical protein
MADHGIQKSRHLLKHLEEEMIFMSTLVSQIENLASQVQFVSSGIKRTWSDIDKIYEEWIHHTDNS